MTRVSQKWRFGTCQLWYFFDIINVSIGDLCEMTITEGKGGLFMSDKKETITLPLLITRGFVIYPGSSHVIEVGRRFTFNAFKASRASANSLLIITSQNDPNVEYPGFDDIYHIGTLCRILSSNDREDGTRVRVEPLERVSILSMVENDGYFVSEVLVNNIQEIDEQTNRVILDSINFF